MHAENVIHQHLSKHHKNRKMQKPYIITIPIVKNKTDLKTNA